jgi:hypothetical protein
LPPKISIKLAAIEIVLQRLLDQAEIFVTSQRAATNRQDAAIAGYLTVTIAVIKRRQQLAQRKVKVYYGFAPLFQILWKKWLIFCIFTTC